MSEFKKNLGAIGIGFIFALILLVVVDNGFRIAKYFGFSYPSQDLIAMVNLKSSPLEKHFEVPSIWRNRPIANLAPYSKKESTKGFFKDYTEKPDHTVNWASAPEPNESYRIRETNLDTGKAAYDVEYKIDNYGYRFVPRASEGQASRYAIFLGCSFTYGEGLKETETIPYFFSDLDPTYHSYNIAYHGYGPNDLLARARGDFNLKQMIKQPNGVIFYTFIDDHVQRAIGSSSHFASTKGNHPYFSKNKNGQLIQNKDFNHGEPFFALFANILNASAIGEFFHLDFPAHLDEEHFQFFGQLISDLRDEYSRRFSKSHFYFIFYPGSQLTNAIIPFLEERKIRYLDYSKLPLHRYSKLPMAIEDGHPSAEANRFLSHLIYDDVQSFEKSNDAKTF